MGSSQGSTGINDPYQSPYGHISDMTASKQAQQQTSMNFGSQSPQVNKLTMPNAMDFASLFAPNALTNATIYKNNGSGGMMGGGTGGMIGGGPFPIGMPNLPGASSGGDFGGYGGVSGAGGKGFGGSPAADAGLAGIFGNLAYGNIFGAMANSIALGITGTPSAMSMALYDTAASIAGTPSYSDAMASFDLGQTIGPDAWGMLGEGGEGAGGGLYGGADAGAAAGTAGFGGNWGGDGGGGGGSGK